MGFLDKMKASVGIGGAKIELAVPDSPAPKGGTLHGTVILTGGKIAQRCNGITVTLRVTRMVPQSVEGTSSERQVTEVLAELALPNSALDVAAGATHQFAFSLAIPLDGGGPTATSLAAHATADIPGAIDPSDAKVIQLGDPVAPGWNWTARIDGMLTALANDSTLVVHHAQRGAPLTDAELAQVEESIGYRLDPRFVAFFRAANGLRVLWSTKGIPLHMATQFEQHLAGSINVPSLSQLFAPPPEHVFVVGTKPREHRVDALGGWDAFALRTALRDLDNYAEFDNEAPYHRPALVVDARFSDPPVLMTQSYAASLSDRAPMLARDYLALVVATFGIDARLARFKNFGYSGNHPMFVAPASWYASWVDPVARMALIADGGGVDKALTTGEGEPLAQTPYAAYHDAPPAPPMRISSDPNAGVRAWPAADNAYVPSDFPYPTLLAPMFGEDAYGVREPIDHPSIAAARKLIGQPVWMCSKYVGAIIGVLVSVDDEGTLTVVQMADGMSGSMTANAADITGFGRAFLREPL